MAKFQWRAPTLVGEIIARVKIKTSAKGLALEYLLYLAKHRPDFPKKDYGNDQAENCTLGMMASVYADDFGDYRERQSPVIGHQQSFFADALGRGASMFEAGYRLSDARRPQTAQVTADTDWRVVSTLTTKAFLHLAEPNKTFEEIDVEEADVQQGALFLLRLFEGHHINPDVEERRKNFAESVRNYVRSERERRPELLENLKAALDDITAGPRPTKWN